MAKERQMKVMALITARGNSKSIPGKNVMPIGGRPLIAWTVEAARAARRVDRVVLSTDSPAIAELGRRYGAETPFLRPAEFAGDASPHIQVAQHALDWLRTQENYVPDYLLLLQPTSPLRTAADIDAAIRLAEEKQADHVVGVCAAENHPMLTKRLNDAGQLENFVDSNLKYLRRQDLPPAYVLNGAIYVNRVTALLRDGSFAPPGALAYEMPRERSVDLDEPWQIPLLESLLQQRLGVAA